VIGQKRSHPLVTWRNVRLGSKIGIGGASRLRPPGRRRRSPGRHFDFVFRVSPSQVTIVGTEFRLAAYIPATQVTRDFSHSKNCAVINHVPLGRYFVFVGILLLGMLFIADWYLPSASPQTLFPEARVNKSIIRIKSAHKWPEPIVIDTSLPTIVPPLPVLAKAPVINQPRDALAQLNSPLPKASEYPGPVRAKRKVAAQTRPTRTAAYRAIPEVLPAGW
jgi:hypothetical protein